jgi:hypothetical protein
MVHHHPAATGGGAGNSNKQMMATTAAEDGVAALYNSSSHQQQEEWTTTMEDSNCSVSPGSSDDGTMLPLCCRRPLKTLDLFPTKSSTGGLKDECSSSKSSCSTSTN